MSRRGFLGIGTAATALLSVAGAAAMSGCARDEEARLDGYRPRVLSGHEYHVLATFCGHMLDAPARLTAHEAGIARRIDSELTFHSDSRLAEDVKNALLVIEYGPFLRGFAARFTRLRHGQRSAYISGLPAARLDLLRDACNGLRLLAVFFYYTDDRTWKDIGYAGPLAKRKLPESANTIEVTA